MTTAREWTTFICLYGEHSIVDAVLFNASDHGHTLLRLYYTSVIIICGKYKSEVLFLFEV